MLILECEAVANGTRQQLGVEDTAAPSGRV